MEFKIWSYNFSVAWIFIAIILFCIYIFFGLYVTEKFESFIQKILGWVIYTILWVTFLNVFILSYFWSVVQNKTGPPGLRGPEGETGSVGIKGHCGITADQAYCMQQLNIYINDLYKGKTNREILNNETQKFPCTYLNEKIQKISGSLQFQIICANLTNDNKTVDSIVNYLKSLWKEWFNLIFNATSVPGVWFTDQYGDEQYGWSGQNPFNEIKKYDVYYWGITRDFRPLKAEICRSTFNHNSEKFPSPQVLKSQDTYDEPRIRIMETNYYKYVANDWKTDGDPDVAFWRPRPVKKDGYTYYPVGDIIIQTPDRNAENNFYWPASEDNPRGFIKSGPLIMNHSQFPDPQDFTLDTNSKFFQGYTYENSDDKLGMSQVDYINSGTGPDLTTILVAGDVESPIGAAPVKDIDDTGRFWNNNMRIICPEGYTSMGDNMVSRKMDMDFNAVKHDQLKCVPTECLEKVTTTPTSEWEWSGDYNIYGIRNPDVENRSNERGSHTNAYNLFRVGPDESAPLYKFKKTCLEKTPRIPIDPVQLPPSPDTKEVETKNDKLGIGWYGHPYKLDPKYSIFSFMNLVPEGMIVNVGTGQRFYIVHVEGDDINLFNVLTYNKKTNKYNGSLRAVEYRIDPHTSQRVQYNGDLSEVKSPLVRKLKMENLKISETWEKSDLYDPNELEFDETYNPDKRIEIITLQKLDKRQQWKIILAQNKKFFTLKNVVKNTYLYIGQEPREGIIEFSTVDLDNNNYLNDPAFQNLESDELYNKTNFSFISTFGTQLNIIDNSGE